MTLDPARLGISGFWFRELELPHLLRLLVDDLGVRRLGLWPHNLGTLPPADIRQALRHAGVEAYALNVPSSEARLNMGVDPAPAQRVILDALALADELEIPLVQTYAGTDTRLDSITAAQAFARELEPCVREAERRGLVVAVENNLDQRGEDPDGVNPSRHPEALLAVAEHFRSRAFGLVYDPCNFYTVGEEPFPRPYELLKPHIVVAEVKDVVRFDERLHGPRSQHHLLVDTREGPFLPVAVGEGAINVHGLLRRLMRDDFQHPLVFDPFATGDALLPMARQSLSYLRRELEPLGRPPTPHAAAVESPVAVRGMEGTR